MVKIEINVPRLDWLIGGSRIGGTYNKYFGSLGTDSSLGCMHNKIFNYGIWIEKIMEDEKIVAVVYYGLKSFDNLLEDEYEEEYFDCGAESLPEIEKWLLNMAEKYFEE
ncbi:MAG: hypothetical protein IJ262_03635 [Clostridia bacterium]|nr:hypothetical protein [Clostridia bacterium]